MTITIITITNISAAEGKILYDGKDYRKDVYLPEGEDPSKWEEVDDPEELNDNSDEDISELEETNE